MDARAFSTRQISTASASGRVWPKVPSTPNDAYVQDPRQHPLLKSVTADTGFWAAPKGRSRHPALFLGRTSFSRNYEGSSQLFRHSSSRPESPQRASENTEVLASPTSVRVPTRGSNSDGVFPARAPQLRRRAASALSQTRGTAVVSSVSSCLFARVPAAGKQQTGLESVTDQSARRSDTPSAPAGSFAHNAQDLHREGRPSLVAADGDRGTTGSSSGACEEGGTVGSESFLPGSNSNLLKAEGDRLKSMGDAQFARGDCPAAHATYTAALQVDAGNVSARYSRSACSLLLLRYEECEEDCRQVWHACPTNYNVACRLAKVCTIKGFYDEAERHYCDALRLASDASCSPRLLECCQVIGDLTSPEAIAVEWQGVREVKVFMDNCDARNWTSAVQTSRQSKASIFAEPSLLALRMRALVHDDPSDARVQLQNYLATLWKPKLMKNKMTDSGSGTFSKVRHKLYECWRKQDELLSQWEEHRLLICMLLATASMYCGYHFFHFADGAISECLRQKPMYKPALQLRRHLEVLEEKMAMISSLTKDGKYVIAIRVVSEAISLDRDNRRVGSMLYALRANLYSKLGEKARAVGDCDEALRLHGGNAKALAIRVAILSRQADEGEAVELPPAASDGSRGPLSRKEKITSSTHRKGCKAEVESSGSALLDNIFSSYVAAKGPAAARAGGSEWLYRSIPKLTAAERKSSARDGRSPYYGSRCSTYHEGSSRHELPMSSKRLWRKHSVDTAAGCRPGSDQPFQHFLPRENLPRRCEPGTGTFGDEPSNGSTCSSQSDSGSCSYPFYVSDPFVRSWKWREDEGVEAPPRQSHDAIRSPANGGPQGPHQRAHGNGGRGEAGTARSTPCPTRSPPGCDPCSTEKKRQGTLYDDLGLELFSSMEEVRSQFKKLSLRYHPDRHVGASEAVLSAATKKIQAINHAYNILSKDTEKEKYDAALLLGQ